VFGCADFGEGNVMKKFSMVDSIEVSSPCSQDWNTMQGSDEIRFCDHCVKDVHNLSAIKRKDVRKLLLRSQGGICVRYTRRPDGRIDTLKRRFHQLTRQTGIAAGVLGTSLTVSSLAYAQTTEPNLPQQDPAAAELTVKENSTSGGTISGVITDQNDAVITFALVTIFNETGSVYQSTPTNLQGYYEFKNVPEGSYKLKVDAGGFESKELSAVAIGEGGSGRQDVQLSIFKVQENVEVGDGKAWQTVTVGGAIVCDDVEKNVTKNKLILAVQSDNLEEVKNLIGQGKKVNVKNTYDEGNFPLHYAVENGNVEMVELLLNAGAKIFVKNYEKRTPLMMLDYDASPELVNMLLRFGAAVNAVDKDKNTVLILAAGNTTEDVIRVLILNGADVNAVNKKGRTALMQAASEQSLEQVKLLLESGADVSLRDKEGQTAWDMTNAHDIRDILVSHGAIPVSQ
jgi:ankyrin repeat protein